MFLRCRFSFGIQHCKNMLMPHGMHYVFIASGLQALELNGSMMGQMICTWFEVVCNVVSLCSAHPSLQIYTRLLFCTLSFESDWSLGMGACRFGHFLTCFLVHWHAGTQWGAFPVHCNLWTFWGRGGSFCTLPNLGKEGVARGYLYVAKSTHKGIPGVPYPWQSQPQKMVPQTMHLERGSKSNSIEDHVGGDRQNEDHRFTIIFENLQSPGLFKIATTIFRCFLQLLYYLNGNIIV